MSGISTGEKQIFQLSESFINIFFFKINIIFIQIKNVFILNLILLRVMNHLVHIMDSDI